ncbi:MAG: DUF3093 domain-containing protein [Acidimicrobiales bacterium]|nr:MAG: DUF3093 domain-containing protein [Acidimicrobiales bacterium]
MKLLLPGTRQLRADSTEDYDLLFAERWRAPWWYWLAGLILAVAVAAAIHLGYPGLRAIAPYVVTVPLVVGLLCWLSRVEVRITVTALYVDDAELAREFIAEAMPLSREAYRAALGPGFDPLAFVVRRPWITEAVLITLCDPNDPTPYWIISSRHPAELVAALKTKLPMK